MIPDDLFYTEDHVWLRPEEDWAVVGVTEPLIRRIKPLISVDMLAADDDMKRQVPFGELEGREETRQLYPPVETRILEVNEELIWDQTKLEQDPYGEGWLMRIALPEGPGLLHMMTSTAYTEFCEKDLGEDSADG